MRGKGLRTVFRVWFKQGGTIVSIESYEFLRVKEARGFR